MSLRDHLGFPVAVLSSIVLHATLLAAWRTHEHPQRLERVLPALVFKIDQIAPEPAAPPAPPPVEPEPPPAPRPAPPPRAVPKPVKKAAPKPPPRPAAPARVEAPPQVAAVPAAPAAPPRAPQVDPKVRANYKSVLLAWLERHKRYPRSALRRRMEGRPVVWMRVARDGRLLEHRLTGRSSHEMLDRAALAMVARAAPLPAVPDAIPGDSFVYEFGVNFELEDDRSPFR